MRVVVSSPYHQSVHLRTLPTDFNYRIKLVNVGAQLHDVGLLSTNTTASMDQDDLTIQQSNMCYVYNGASFNADPGSPTLTFGEYRKIFGSVVNCFLGNNRRTRLYPTGFRDTGNGATRWDSSLKLVLTNLSQDQIDEAGPDDYVYNGHKYMSFECADHIYYSVIQKVEPIEIEEGEILFPNPWPSEAYYLNPGHGAALPMPELPSNGNMWPDFVVSFPFNHWTKTEYDDEEQTTRMFGSHSASIEQAGPTGTIGTLNLDWDVKQSHKTYLIKNPINGEALSEILNDAELSMYEKAEAMQSILSRLEKSGSQILTPYTVPEGGITTHGFLHVFKNIDMSLDVSLSYNVDTGVPEEQQDWSLLYQELAKWSDFDEPTPPGWQDWETSGPSEYVLETEEDWVTDPNYRFRSYYLPRNKNQTHTNSEYYMSYYAS